MSVTWRNKVDATAVLVHLEKARSVSRDGKVTYSGITLQEHAAVLESITDFGEGLPATDRRGIVNKALFAAVPKGSRLNATFLPAVERALTEYYHQPLRKLIILTGVSARMETGRGPSFQSGRGTRIAFPPRVHHAMSSARTPVLRDKDRLGIGDLPSNYRWVLARTSARTTHAAVEQALDAIDEIRGIWNWYFNRQQSFRWSDGRPKPVNRLLLHPIHTVHEVSGQLATEAPWYQTEFRSAVTPVDITADRTKIATFTRRVSGIPPVFRTLPIGANMAQEVLHGTAFIHGGI